jgi:hypothetical protein
MIYREKYKLLPDANAIPDSILQLDNIQNDIDYHLKRIRELKNDMVAWQVQAAIDMRKNWSQEDILKTFPELKNYYLSRVRP